MLEGNLLFGIVGMNSSLITMGVRGRAMETVGRYKAPSSSLGNIFGLFIKSESTVSTKINDLSRVQVLLQDVLAFSYGLGMLKDFGQDPGRERRDTQLRC